MIEIFFRSISTSSIYSAVNKNISIINGYVIQCHCDQLRCELNVLQS